MNWFLSSEYPQVILFLTLAIVLSGVADYLEYLT
jgi:hypothetical protein